MKRREKIALENYPIYEFSSKDINRRDRNIFLQGYEQAEKETIDYACYQLELRLPEVLNYEDVLVKREDFINDFKKAMKED